MAIFTDLRSLATHPGFRKLFTVRLVSQTGDGMFQAGLATLFFFSPQNLATPAAVAGAFAVLLLPFTVVGPFAGPLLDRWSRRQVLVVANAARCALTLLTAMVLVTGTAQQAVYLLALVILGLNRFLLAALSAGLPRVVGPGQLLLANTLTPSLGAAAAAVGAGLGLLLTRLVPAALREAGTLVVAAFIFALAAALALRLRRDELGPTQVRSHLGADLRAVCTDLAAGARYLARRGTPGRALLVMSVHRFLYGMNFIALILISRNLLADPANPDAGLAMFATLTAISFAGNGLGILATPVAHEHLSTHTWVVVCVSIGAASQLLLAAGHTYLLVAGAAFGIGVSVQGAKIAVDTIIQRDTNDTYRGRAFSLYDMAYNAAFAGAAALAAPLLPASGWSPVLCVTLAAIYALAAGWFARTPTTAAALP